MFRIDHYHHSTPDKDTTGRLVRIEQMLGILTQEVKTMADNEASAIADLAAEIDLMFAKIDELSAALAAATGVDHSADIAALKDKIAAKLTPPAAPAAPADPAAPPA